MLGKSIRAKVQGGEMEVFDNIAISSRIRLARNVEDFKFYTKQNSDEDALFITSEVRKVLDKFDLFNFMSLKDLSLNECNALFEQHLISKELIANKDISGVAISEDESVIVMINEEDHIREQCIQEGFNLLKAYRKISKIDDGILKNLNIAFDENLGFITASPANLGTGMRASVMLFLPALEFYGKINEIIDRAGRAHLTVRGLYGEGSQPIGSFYQISNQGTFGFSEEEIIDLVTDFIFKLCSEEKTLREEMLVLERDRILDEGRRAYAILTNAYMLEELETMELLSKLKLVCELGNMVILDEKGYQKLYFECGTAFLKEIFGDKKKENVLRAEYISKKVKNLVRRM